MATQSSMSSALRISRKRILESAVRHDKKSHKKHTKTTTDSKPSSLKQKSSSKFVPEDIDKILTFLKTTGVPQKTIYIAKACGYNSARYINPTIYHMEKQNLVQKINNSPPTWVAFVTNVSSPTRDQHQEKTYNKAIQNEERDRYQPKPKFGKDVTEKPSNSALSGRTRSNSASKAFSQTSVISHEAGVSNLTALSNQQISHHESLFKKTINDKTAPGAYKVQDQLEHSHEKRMDTYNLHRKHSPNWPDRMSSEHHVLDIPTVLQEHTEDHSLSNIEHDGDIRDKNDAYDRTFSTHYMQNSPSTIASMEANIPLTFDNNIVVNNVEEDSDCTDDEDYDLNFRISDVVSIRDLDYRTDPSVLKNTDVKPFTQNCIFEDISLNNDQETEVNLDQEMSDSVCTSENDHEEIWIGDGYLGPTIHSKTNESKQDTDAVQKIIDSNVLQVLYSLPLKITMKNTLASTLSMAQGDLQKLLHTCCNEGWVDYSPLGHVRLTDAGVKFLLELEQSGKHISVMQPSSGPPPYPDQLLQSISKSHESTWQHAALRNTSQYSASRNQEHPQNQSNSACNLSYQFNSVQEIDISNKKLMPWLPSNSQVPNNKQVSCSSEFTNTAESSSSLLFTSAELSLPTLQKTSYSLHAIPSTFRQYLSMDNRSGIPAMELPALIDTSNMNQRMMSLPCTSFSSQPEQLQQKRAPLLSTPETRASSSSSKNPAGSGKVALLPYPGHSTQQLHQQFKVHQLDTPSNLQISTESFAALNKNPISAFMEYGQCRHTPARIEVVSQRGPSHKPVFTIAAILGNRVFPGITSGNKKDGKKDAAEQAIRILIAEGQYNMPANSSVMSIPESNMTQFDKIAALTHHKFNQLIALIPESLVGRKVIAGLVMKMDDTDTGTVVAVGSGNRCITGDKLSLRGVTVNDCHAEIITRRGFMRFLHHQLRSYNANEDHPLFEKSPTGKLRLKKSITFHLYISTAPCGDGALFSPRDVESNNVALTNSCTRHRPTFETNVQGVLRTKMEGGEGTIPLDPEKPVQTWDGIVRGERLRTMSCSDKICRWNVVGIQGALLANFLDPVYLNSITLGFLFDAGHLSRAVCCRLNRGEPPLEREIHSPYHLNHPILGRVTACEATRETQKTKSYSINWMVKDEKPEIVDGCQGTCYTGDKSESPQASRLCKKSMFHFFKETCQILGQKELLSVPTYYKAKRMCTEFLQAKEAMIKKFKDTNCGIWLGKPPEEEMFS